MVAGWALSISPDVFKDDGVHVHVRAAIPKDGPSAVTGGEAESPARRWLVRGRLLRTVLMAMTTLVRVKTRVAGGPNTNGRRVFFWCNRDGRVRART